MPTIVDHDAMTALLAEEFEAITSFGQTLQDSRLGHAYLPARVDGARQPEPHDRHRVDAAAAPQSRRRGQRVAPMCGTPSAKANEVWVDSMRSWPGTDVLARFADVTGAADRPHCVP